MSEALLCPRCEVNYFTPYGGPGPAPEEVPYPAMSRVVDIYICSECGVHEAFMDLTGVPLPPATKWPVVLGDVP